MKYTFFDRLFIVYFVAHIPITLLFASQVVFFDAPWIPSVMKSILKSAVELSNDPLLLMGLVKEKREPWMISFFAMELFLQVPFFFYLLKGFIQRNI
jgi:hypothetical protein